MQEHLTDQLIENLLSPAQLLPSFTAKQEWYSDIVRKHLGMKTLLTWWCWQGHPSRGGRFLEPLRGTGAEHIPQKDIHPSASGFGIPHATSRDLTEMNFKGTKFGLCHVTSC